MSDLEDTETDSGARDAKHKGYAAKVFVGNLDFKTSSEDLSDLFSSFGAVIGVNVRTDRKTGKAKGFAFVTFASPASATAAIAEMHGRTFKGRALTVNAADVRGTNADGHKDKDSDKGSAKPVWLTVPTPRKIEPVAVVFTADKPYIRDYSGVPVPVPAPHTSAPHRPASKSSSAAAIAAPASSADVSASASASTSAGDQSWEGTVGKAKSKGGGGGGGTRISTGAGTGEEKKKTKAGVPAANTQPKPNLWTSWTGPA